MDNREHCRNIINNLSKEQILRALVRSAQHYELTGESRRPAWSHIGHWLQHGSGVSSMIVEMYSEPATCAVAGNDE